MVNSKRALYIFLFAFITVAACASTFPYRWYGIGPDKDGNLLGTVLAEKEKDDFPLSRCMPDEEETGKCVLLLREEFTRLMEDYEAMRERLDNCKE